MSRTRAPWLVLISRRRAVASHGPLVVVRLGADQTEGRVDAETGAPVPVGLSDGDLCLTHQCVVPGSRYPEYPVRGCPSRVCQVDARCDVCSGATWMAPRPASERRIIHRLLRATARRRTRATDAVGTGPVAEAALPPGRTPILSSYGRLRAEVGGYTRWAGPRQWTRATGTDVLRVGPWYAWGRGATQVWRLSPPQRDGHVGGPGGGARATNSR